MSSSDGKILLWDMKTLHAIGEQLGDIGDGVIEVAFADGPTLASRKANGPVMLWDADAESWKMRACEIAGRNLSAEEWRQYLADEEQGPTCVSAVLMEADTAALAGAHEEARTKFEVVTAMARRTANFVLNNRTCWYGTLDDYAAVVMPACERAVELQPDDVVMQAEVRDSRGVARAAVGDFKGALADFEFFIARSGEQGEIDRGMRRLRESWLAVIRQGRNPIDKETLKALRAE